MNKQIINGMPVAFTGIPTFLMNQGDRLMEEMFDCVPIGQMMTVAEIARRMPSLCRYAERTKRQYVSALLRYLIAEGQTANEPQVKRVNSLLWRF